MNVKEQRWVSIFYSANIHQSYNCSVLVAALFLFFRNWKPVFYRRWMKEVLYWIIIPRPGTSLEETDRMLAAS